MTIEDIPEMQIVSFVGSRLISVPAGSLIRTKGRFVVMQQDGRTWVYAQHDSDNLRSHSDLDMSFRYSCKCPTRDIKTSGGGFFEVGTDSLRIYGKSEKLGKYDEQVVRPIVERWAKQHLPSHQLSFS